MKIVCERWHATLDDSHCGERFHCRGCPKCPEKTDAEWAAMKRRMGYGGVEGIVDKFYARTKRGDSAWKHMGAVK